MKDFLKKLFDYNYQTNNNLFIAFNNNQEKVSEKALSLFNHLINAHQIWNNRIDPQQNTYGVWEIHPFIDLEEINYNNYQHSKKIIDTLDINKAVDYKNSNGQPFSKNMHDMLFHVINHSTYHRAQIATEFKLSDITPLSTDYILFK